MSVETQPERFVVSSPETVVEYTMLKLLETSTQEGIGLTKRRLIFIGKQAYYGATMFTIPSTPLCREAAETAERCFIRLLTGGLMKPTERFAKTFYIITDVGQTSIGDLSQSEDLDTAATSKILQMVREIPPRRISGKRYQQR